MCNYSLIFAVFGLSFVPVATSSAMTETSLSQDVGNQNQPNVIVIFVDDLGYHDLSCNNSTFYKTPRIDGLANIGVRFTNFYSAHPVCSPTRAALMTGKAPQRVGITQWLHQPSEKHLPLNETTLGEAFQEMGYETAYLGKWHLGHADENQPTANGFGWQQCVNRAGQPGSYFFPYKRKRKNGSGKSYWDVPDAENGKPGDYLSDHLTSRAIDFVTTNQDKPFFLCLSHYAVHTPIQSPPKLVKKYRDKKRLELGSESPSPLKERNNSNSRARQDNPDYAAMVENLDDNVGRMIDHLDKLNLTNKTIVVFTSDNGGLSTLPGRRVGPTSCVPLRAGKGWTYEGGIRIPTSITWPSTIKPSVSDTLGITMDLYPTLLRLVGGKLRPKQHLDGMDLSSAISGNASETLRKRFLAWHYPHKHGSGHTPSNALRRGDWKLIHKSDSSEYELYNLRNDVGEAADLASEFPDRVQQMSKSLSDWLAETTNFADE